MKINFWFSSAFISNSTMKINNNYNFEEKKM